MDNGIELQEILWTYDGYFSHFTTCHFSLSQLLAKLQNEKLSFTVIVDDSAR